MSDLPPILEVQNITGAVRKFDFKDEFLSQNLKFLLPEHLVDGSEAIIDVEETNSGVPEFTSADGPATTRGLTSRGTISVSMPFIKESFFISSDKVAKLRQIDGDKNKGNPALTLLARELKESARRVARAKEVLRFKALSRNDYTLVIDGELVTVETPYDASHIPDVSGTAPWSDPSTDIRAQLTEWKRLISRESGRIASVILLNPLTLGYVLKNDLVKSLLPGTNLSQTLMSGVEEFQLFGFRWIAWDAYYTDPWTGDVTPYIKDNEIIMVPSSPDWGELQVGEVYYIDDNDQEVKDHGPVSWTEKSRNPVGRIVYTAWAGLAVVTVPSAVVIAKVA